MLDSNQSDRIHVRICFVGSKQLLKQNYDEKYIFKFWLD